MSFWVILLIVSYITLRFNRIAYGISAIIAIFHDVTLILGFVSFMNIEVNAMIIISVLLTFGYSVNDTIILFDRIRENITAKNEWRI